MSFFEIILSSVVIVAIINMTVQNKNNKLQYITQERSNWRKELKEISLELQQAKSSKKMKVSLLKLKQRINSYGQHFDEYPSLIKMDFIKDEHIWKIIDEIESGNGEFEENKKVLLDYIGLLLKFDWERAKNEVKSRVGIVMFCAFGLIGSGIAVFSFIDIKNISWEQIGNAILCMTVFVLGFLVFLLSYVLGSATNFRKRNWFQNDKMELIHWKWGCLIIGVMWVVCMVWNGDSIRGYLSAIFIAIAIIGLIFTVIGEWTLYTDYFEKVLEYTKCMEKEEIKLYNHKNNWKVTRVKMEFSEWNIVRKRYEIAELFSEGKNIELKENMLKIGYRIPFKIFYNIRKEKDLRQFIQKHPKSLKIIIEYKGIYLSGTRKKKMEQFKQNIQSIGNY